ncbi:RluA family pseudouridine synthase [Halalkalibacter urbisdiaboli]|uniref:RluA family pseudouridine synthase n=1 Tax=Halalkalibacter urbisdiaboli TaxID=1960589 RepID=UPI000B454077|nr:RluA family pseudouridine synthase [Halalkalibacter urbisdiaboli]
MDHKIVELHWQVDESYAGNVLRSYLREEQQISKKALADIKFGGGTIKVNGKEATVRTILHTSDVVSITLPPEIPSDSIIPEDIPLTIVYEDEHVMVINKPPGMATIPSREHRTNTLANAVIGYFNREGISSTFHAVNRLDKDTSGLLVVAKHRLAHDRLSKIQKKGNLSRYYQTIVHGKLESQTFTIDAPIGRNEESIIEREVREDGKRAITHCEVVAEGEQVSFVSVKLETGRTHQIRVHFAYIGHPLCGDDLYGGERTFIKRHALHCHQVKFVHPFTGEVLHFQADLPDDMVKVLKSHSLVFQ